ncbi:MAG: BCD family MFS transporter [Anaerolineae bacterium]
MSARQLMLRMGVFQVGFGLVSVLVLGVLNRVMFAEMGLPATLIGLLLAMPSAVSPFRLWVGYMSDSQPVLGYRRLPYILGGMFLAAVGVLGGTLGALWIVRSAAVGVLVSVVAFLVYGMGKNAMATAFQALIADVFDERRRPQATAVLKASFLLGIIGGSVGLGWLVEPYSPSRLISVVVGTGVVALAMSILGCIGVEPRGHAVEAISQRVRRVPFGPTLALTLMNRQVRLFFFFIGATLLATLSQDIFLEPYGAKLFGMSVGQTARVNMYWGIGTLASLLFCGLWVVNRLGRKRVTAVGLVIVIGAFAGLILAGTSGQPALFIGLAFLLGVGSGVSGSGALTMMVDFTTPEQAGLLMGAWTIAHQLAEVLGNVLGGVLLDVVYTASGSYLAAFSTVFGLEIAMALVGLALLPRINLTDIVEAEPPPGAELSHASATGS